MSNSPLRVVLDTNVILRGLVSETSASARIVGLAQARRFLTLLSRDVVEEYRAILLDAAMLEKFPSLSPKRVDAVLARLRYCGEFLRQIAVRFDYPRDLRDAMFVELAIAGKASHIISLDRDLLSLPRGHTDANKRFRQRLPNAKVLQPAEFLSQFQQNQ